MAVRRMARGTQLQREDPGNPGTFVKIAQAVNYDGPAMTAEVFAFDDHDVPAGYKAKLKKGKDGGQITVGVYLDLDEATHQVAFDDFEEMDDPVIAYRLVHPSASKRLAFNAMVVGITPAAPVDGAVTSNIVFEVDGPVVLEDNP